MKIQIPMSLVEGYSRSLNLLSDNLIKQLTSALEQIDFSAGIQSDGRFGSWQIRDQITEIFQTLMPTYTDAAAVIASEVYNEIGRLMTGEEQNALVDSQRDPKATEIAIKGILNQASSSRDLKRLLVKRAGYEVKRAAGQCMYANAKPGVRYARVPTGSETCDFCIMLASRGFVYYTKETAEGHYHANCDCMVIPSFGGKKAVIKGYTDRLDDLYEQYKNSKFNTRKNIVNGDADRQYGQWHQDVVDQKQAEKHELANNAN